MRELTFVAGNRPGQLSVEREPQAVAGERLMQREVAGGEGQRRGDGD